MFLKYTPVFSKFLVPKRRKTLLIDTKLHQFSKFVLIVHGKLWCLSWHHKIAFVGGKREGYYLQE